MKDNELWLQFFTQLVSKCSSLPTTFMLEGLANEADMMLAEYKKRFNYVELI